MEMILLLIISVSVLVEGFFAGTETAFVSCNRIRIKHQARLGRRSALLIESYLADQHKLFSATLTGTNLAIVIGSVLAAALAMRHFGRTAGSLIAIAGLLPLNLVLGELLPKLFFYAYADWLVHLVVWPLKLFDLVFRPLIWLAGKSSDLLLFILGRRGRQKSPPPLGREELRLLLADQTGPRSRQRKMIIDYVFRFRQRRVRQAMIPLAKAVAVEEGSDLDQVRQVFRSSGRSRLLVYRRRPEMPVGCVEARDVLLAPEGAVLSDLTKDLYLVPAGKPISRLAAEMREAGRHLALVVDETGAAVGLITREDIIEEVVGEIIDEFEKQAHKRQNLINDKLLSV